MKDEKIESEQEMKWKVDDAIRSLTEYKKLMEDEKVKKATIKELKRRAEEYKKAAKELP